MMVQKTDGKKILIVDDQTNSIEVLRGILSSYETVHATIGEQALEMVRSDAAPDLILLDVMMPGMDGFEVCRRLKADEKTRDIPIIFLTARGEAEDEVRGLELGAVDYINKPFQTAVVRARVHTHLSLRMAYLELARQLAVQKKRERSQEDLDVITRHDLKSPINGLIGFSELLLSNKKLTERQVNKFLRHIHLFATRLRDTVNKSLDLIKMERGTYQVTAAPVDLLVILDFIVHANDKIIVRKNLHTEIRFAGRPLTERDRFGVRGEESLCYNLLSNLIVNALEAATAGGLVTISLWRRQQRAVIEIHNPGAVPASVRDHFFEKYVSSKRSGTGLGTYSAKLMVETQGGEIRMHTSEAEGTTVTVSLIGVDDENIDRG